MNLAQRPQTVIPHDLVIVNTQVTTATPKAEANSGEVTVGQCCRSSAKAALAAKRTPNTTLFWRSLRIPEEVAKHRSDPSSRTPLSSLFSHPAVTAPTP